jgi:hypothetical protein
MVPVNVCLSKGRFLSMPLTFKATRARVAGVTVVTLLLGGGLTTAAFAGGGNNGVHHGPPPPHNQNGPRTPSTATNESFSECSATLCIDAPPEGPPGDDGSGGWGWNSAANNGAGAPVTSLQVGQPASFTVTTMEPNDLSTDGSPGDEVLYDGDPATITLAYSSYDFSLSPTDSTGVTGANPFDRGGVEVFTYPDGALTHNVDKSVAFTFTPQNAANTALVTATVQIWTSLATDPSGNLVPTGLITQASETYPVAITGSAKT